MKFGFPIYYAHTTIGIQFSPDFQRIEIYLQQALEPQNTMLLQPMMFDIKAPAPLYFLLFFSGVANFLTRAVHEYKNNITEEIKFEINKKLEEIQEENKDCETCFE